MYKFIAIISSLLVPLGAFAQQVAVLPVSYKVYRTAAESTERAAKVRAAAVKSTEKMGMTAVDRNTVEAATNALAPGGSTGCMEDACLAAVAERCGASFSVGVSVVDNDGQFDIKVAVNGVETGTASPFGTFNAMLKRVAGMVESSLKEAKERMETAEPEQAQEEVVEQEAPPEEPPKEADQQPDVVEPDKTVPPPDGNRHKKPVSKVAFFTTLGVTVGIGAAYGAVTGIGWSKWNKYKESGDYTADDKNWLENMQLSSRVLFGALAAGVITTVILGPLTKFKNAKNKVAVVPSFTEQMGGVLLQGEF